MENYVVLDGQRFELNDLQVESLKNGVGVFVDFMRTSAQYYYINSIGEVVSGCDRDYQIDLARYDEANYCHNVELLRQRALHEKLDRLLWRASISAGENKNNWVSCDDYNLHWYIYLSNKGDFYIDNRSEAKHHEIYFPTEDSAKFALENIVKPFVVEHPEFIW